MKRFLERQISSNMGSKMYCQKHLTCCQENSQARKQAFMHPRLPSHCNEITMLCYGCKHVQWGEQGSWDISEPSFVLQEGVLRKLWGLVELGHPHTMLNVGEDSFLLIVSTSPSPLVPTLHLWLDVEKPDVICMNLLFWRHMSCLSFTET